MVFGKVIRIKNTSKKSIQFSYTGTSPADCHANIGKAENVDDMLLQTKCDFASDIVLPFQGYGSAYLGETKDSKDGVYLSVGPISEDRWNNYLLMVNADDEIVSSVKLGNRGMAFMDAASVSVSITVTGPEGKPMSSRVSVTVEEAAPEAPKEAAKETPTEAPQATPAVVAPSAVVKPPAVVVKGGNGDEAGGGKMAPGSADKTEPIKPVADDGAKGGGKNKNKNKNKNSNKGKGKGGNQGYQQQW